MAAVLSASAKRTNKGPFLHVPEVCSDFSLGDRQVVELNVLDDTLYGGCEACGQLYGSPKRSYFSLSFPESSSLNSSKIFSLFT